MDARFILEKLVGNLVSFTLHVGLDNELLLGKTLTLFVSKVHVAEEFLVFLCGCLGLSNLDWFLNGVVVTGIQINVEVLNLSFFEGHKSHRESFNDEFLGFLESFVNAQGKKLLMLQVGVSNGAEQHFQILSFEWLKSKLFEGVLKVEFVLFV